MEDKSNHKKFGSINTISTNSSERNIMKKNASIMKIDDSRYYLNDKTKKCVRAMYNNTFGDMTKNVKGYAGNLNAKDHGMKKVRFVQDLKNVKNSSEIILRGFSDKRDFKDFKRKMIVQSWETNVEERK